MHLLRAAEELTDMVAPYQLDRRPRDGARCWVLANMVAGLDGTAAVAGRVGALSHETDATLFRLLRSVADVVLVGAETVRREGYGPVVLPDDRRADRVTAGRPATPPLAIVTRSLRLDWDSPLFAPVDGASAPVVVTCGSADAALLERARGVARVVVSGDEEVDLGGALGQLRSLGHEVVLCEGGPTLLGQLAAEGLLDELCLSLSPMMGGDPLPVAITPVDGGATAFELCHVAADRGTLFLRYEVTHGE